MNEQAIAEIQAIIAQHGFAIIPVPGTADQPGFVYSVGFQSQFNHPEIIAFGLPDDLAQTLVQRILIGLGDDVSFKDGFVYEQLLNDFSCCFRKVLPQYQEDFMPMAHAIHAGQQWQALQVIWPDTDGHFPWDEQYDRRYDRYQPSLYQAAPAGSDVQQVNGTNTPAADDADMAYKCET